MKKDMPRPRLRQWQDFCTDLLRLVYYCKTFAKTIAKNTAKTSVLL